MNGTTQEARVYYAQNLIRRIGVCDSVKAVSMDDYNMVLAVVQNHPEADIKLRDIEDFCIMENAMGGGMLLQAVRVIQ